MSREKREYYIQSLEEILESELIRITHEAYFTEGAIEELLELFKEEPERKKGEWIDYSDEGYVECPFCHSATNCDGNKDELHYCFSCGADMRGDNR